MRVPLLGAQPRIMQCLAHPLFPLSLLLVLRQDSWGRADCIAPDPQCGCAKCESDEEWNISLDPQCQFTDAECESDEEWDISLDA